MTCFKFLLWRSHITPHPHATSTNRLPRRAITTQKRNKEEWAPRSRYRTGRMNLKTTNNPPLGKTLVSIMHIFYWHQMYWKAPQKTDCLNKCYIFQSRQQEENPFVPVPPGLAKKWRHEWQYLVGGPGQGHLPVLHKTQRSSGQPVGYSERESQENDLSKDGSSSEELW